MKILNEKALSKDVALDVAEAIVSMQRIADELEDCGLTQIQLCMLKATQQNLKALNYELNG